MDIVDIKEEFCENIRTCQNSMYALAYSILKNEQDAADAISESILKAYMNINQLKNNRSFKPWILKIVHNTSIEMLRKKHPTLDLEEQYDLADESSSHDLSTKLVLRQAVDNLNQPYRTVVILFYYEGMSLIEISRVTGDSVTAVKKQLSRARTMIRESLNKEDFF